MSYAHGSQIIEEILERYKSVIGSDFAAYRGHALRVRAFALKLGWDQSDHLLQVAAATHDLAVWTHDTVDYLEPSGNLAAREAAERGFNRAEQEILRAVVANHHKLTSCSKQTNASAEIFRRADWIDVTRGNLRFGLPLDVVADIRKTIPDAGFAQMLRGLLNRCWRERPWQIPPMMKL